MGANLNDYRSNFSEISQKYGITLMDVSECFTSALEVFYVSNNIQFVGNGIHVNGKYRNVKKSDMETIEGIFVPKLVTKYSENVKNYLKTTMLLNNNTLYCKFDKEEESHFVMQPYLNKDTPLKQLSVRISKDRPLPLNLNLFPVYIMSNIKKTEANHFVADGLVMSKKLAEFHINLLAKKVENNLKKIINVKVEFLQSKNSKEILILSSKEMLPKPVINYIVNYFKSFHIEIFFKNDHLDQHKNIRLI
jgi:hypothetical protein